MKTRGSKQIVPPAISVLKDSNDTDEHHQRGLRIGVEQMAHGPISGRLAFPNYADFTTTDYLMSKYRGPFLSHHPEMRLRRVMWLDEGATSRTSLASSIASSHLDGQ